ncbi:MAG: Bax inhibitor-1/YccA family protein [Streptococcaceae bacterium]|nr:Bax inhibitor-1/YccA family protein [Streptococcaceae bacterium]
MNNVETSSWTLSSFFSRVYAVMALGVGLSAAVAFITIQFFPENLLNLGGGVLIGIWVVEMILVVSLTKSAAKNSAFALPGFLFYSAVNGFVLSYTLAFYPGTIVAQAFITAAAMFAGLAVVGVKTKKDLSGLGRAMYAALFGLIIAGIVSMFFPANGLLGIGLSVIGVVIFSGLIAYDNQMIIRGYQQSNGQVTEGLAILMGLRLYLDFINLFLSLLRIFGILGRD